MTTTNKQGTEVLAKLHQTTKPATLEDWLKKMKPEFAKALPEHIKPDRLLRIAMTSLRVTPKLRTCDPMSFLAAVMTSAQLGLEPNTPLGEAYLIPYHVKGKPWVQFQIGYKGLLTLCYNTGQYRSIYAHPVYKNDKFSWCLGLHKDLQHIEADEQIGEPIYYYAVYHLLNGGFDFAVWSRKKVERHRDEYSPSGSYDSSSWKTAFDEMAKKTVLKAALKYAPKSIELARQLSLDETVKSQIAPDMSEVPPEEIDITNEVINKVTGEVEINTKLEEAKAKAEEVFSKDETISDEDIPNV